MRPISNCFFAIMLMLCCGHVVLSAEPVRIAEGQGTLAPKQPQMCVALDGSVHLVFGVAGDVHYSRSRDGGETFDPPKVACHVPNMSLGMRRGPRIAVTEKAIVISAIGGKRGKGQDGDVMAWHSDDNGETWEGPTRVNDVDDSAREGLHAMAGGADGGVWCVWLDLRGKGTELFASKSTDGGQTWSDNTLIYRSPEKGICECCHPSIAIVDNAIYVLFRNSLAGNRDMYIVSSKDNGRTFLPATRLGLEHWALNACPMDGGMLAVAASGKIATVWRRGGELFFTSDSQTENSLGRGEQAWITYASSGPLAVWTEGRIGKLQLRNLSNPESRVVSVDARDAVIASQGEHIVIGWESITDSASAIMAMKIDPH